MRLCTLSHLVCVILAVALSPRDARAAGGEFSPILELGVNLHSGDETKSMSGALGLLVSIKAEKRKGWFRLHGAFELQTAVGKVYTGSDQPNGSLYGAGFLAGVHLFFFQKTKFMPFVGGSGVFAWHFMKLSPAPTGVETNTQGLAFGYETTAGADIRLGSVDGTAIRIRAGFLYLVNTLAGQSGFRLDGIRFTIGMVW